MSECDSAVFYVWQSVKDLLEYAEFVPEVVGTADELLLIGSVPADRLVDANNLVSKVSMSDLLV